VGIFYSNGEKGYKNLVTGEMLKMNNEKLIISSIKKTNENRYAVLYPKTIKKCKELTIFNKEKKQHTNAKF
jgi:hypothetical protein